MRSVARGSSGLRIFQGPFHRRVAMQNAYERFGGLELTRRIQDTTTHIRLRLDRFIGEIAESKEGEGRAHLISVVGGDAEVAAVWAAIVEGGFFTVEGPGLKTLSVSLGEEAQCFRGTIAIPGRSRPLRHLVAISAEMAKSRPGLIARAGARSCAMEIPCLCSTGSPNAMACRSCRRGPRGLGTSLNGGRPSSG